MTRPDEALTDLVDLSYDDDPDNADVQQHQRDHDALHISAKQRGLRINVAEYIEAAGGSLSGTADNYTAIQNALNEAVPGSDIFFGPHHTSDRARYYTSQPLVVPDGTKVYGVGGARGDLLGGTTVIVHDSYNIENFRGKGIFNTASYISGNGNPGPPVNFENLTVEGNDKNVNGIVIMNQRSRWNGVFINRIGTEAARQAFVGGTAAGIGYGIVVAATTYAGVALTASGVNNEFHHMRVGSQNNRLYVEPNGGKYTDGALRDFVSLIQPNGPSNVDDISIDSGGGWVLDHVHTNGSGGRAININCLRTFITNCDFDGWAIGAQGQFRTAAVKVGFSNGSGGTNVLFTGNQGRWRGDAGEQTGSSRDPVIFVQSGVANTLVNISDNNFYHQTGVGTNKFFARIDDTSAGNTMQVVMNGNVIDYGVNGEVLDYGGTNPSKWVMEGNSWQYSPTKPTSTSYPRGTRVHHNDAAAGEPAFWQFDGTVWRDGPNLV